MATRYTRIAAGGVNPLLVCRLWGCERRQPLRRGWAVLDAFVFWASSQARSQTPAAVYLTMLRSIRFVLHRPLQVATSCHWMRCERSDAQQSHLLRSVQRSAQLIEHYCNSVREGIGDYSGMLEAHANSQLLKIGERCRNIISWHISTRVFKCKDMLRGVTVGYSLAT